MTQVKNQKVGIVGLGYVGLPLALHISSHGSNVVGFDINSRDIENLVEGKSRIPSVSNVQLVELLKSSFLSFTIDPRELEKCQIVIICVPTPLKGNGEIDLSFLESAADVLVDFVTAGTLIVSESTSYPGTLREVFQSRLQEKRKGEKFYLATAPERVDPGSQFSFRDIPRVVSGIDSVSTAKAVEFYSQFFTRVIRVSSPEVAEMSKLLENTFRQVNISLVNEFNDICRRSGINTREVIDAAATKPYGFMKFNPSAGIGGHCIPVDPEYLQFFAKRSGSTLRMVSAASSVNGDMGELIVKRVEGLLAGLRLTKVLLVGVAYKSNIPDVRDTPATAILEAFQSRGIQVDWYDPLVDNWRNEKSSNLIHDKWQVAIVVTAHDEIDINNIEKSCGKVFDCTGKYSNISSIVQI